MQRRLALPYFALVLLVLLLCWMLWPVATEALPAWKAPANNLPVVETETQTIAAAAQRLPAQTPNHSLWIFRVIDQEGTLVAGVPLELSLKDPRMPQKIRLAKGPPSTRAGLVEVALDLQKLNDHLEKPDAEIWVEAMFPAQQPVVLKVAQAT
jgi:hypothetical protein